MPVSGVTETNLGTLSAQAETNRGTLTGVSEAGLGTLAAVAETDPAAPSFTPPPTIPTPPLTPILDSFNRADENPATGWTAFPGVEGVRVLSTKFAAGTTTAQNGAYFNTAMTGPNQEVYITISTLPVNLGSTVIYARNDPSGGGTVGNNYALRHSRIDGTSDQIFISRHDASVATTLATYSQDLSAGDAIRMRCVGSTIEAWVRVSNVWTMLGSVTDVKYDGTGNQTRLSLATQEPSTPTARWDDFGGGTF